MSTHDFPTDRPPHVVRRNRLIYLVAVFLATVAIAGTMAIELTPLVAISLAAVLSALYWGWPHLAGLPNAVVGRSVASVIGGAALIAATLGSVVSVAYVAAVGVLVVYVGEMVRRDGRVRLLSQVVGTYAGGVLGVSAALWLSLVQLLDAPELGIVWIVGMGAAGVVSAFVRGPFAAVATGIASFLGSAVMCLVFPNVSVWLALVFAVILGILAWGLEKMTGQILSHASASTLVSFALVPFCAMGVVGYTLALVMF